MTKRTRALLAVACWALIGSFADGTVSDESKKRSDTIRYGIESQVIELLQTLRSEKSEAYKKEILEAFDASTSPRLRTSILEYLSALSLNDAEGRAADLIGARDSHPEALVSAAFAYLSALRSGAALDEAAEILADDEKRYFQAAIKAIGVAGGAKEAEALRAAYGAEGVDQATKEAVVLALGAMKSKESFDLLASIASSDESAKAIRMYACSALGELGDARSVPTLVGASVASDPNVRAAAIAALGGYPDVAAMAAIREGLRDAHVLPRIAAAKAAGKARDAEAVPYLEYKASYDPEKAVREAAISALSEIGGERVDGFLTAFLSETKNSAQYRGAALGAIISKGGRESRAKALEAFAAAQGEKDRALFTAYAKAAMGVDDPASIPFAELMLGDADFSMRLGALAWAERNEAKELAGAVRALSETDSSDAVKKRAAKALERLVP
ncbi:MAG: HEAT repeat domain-containing protein [Spirochaetes bacterium]|nr:HEAT repeat domain-containing protein [Spirochaetota bacterium]MBU1082204.1 HEAT repeat domain-containing protein [Spirochaetota bacterium]